MDDPPDDLLSVDEELMPWPVPAAVERWWASAAEQMKPRVRHLAGRAITSGAALDEVLGKGSQKQRQIAAQELQIRGQRPPPLFDTGAPGPRQRALLEGAPRGG
jgi:hypothetical protein